MKLEPATYMCPEHQADLTGQVREALDDDASIKYAYSRRFLPGTAAGPNPFEVIVTCPGAADSEPHRLTCTGTYVR